MTPGPLFDRPTWAEFVSVYVDLLTDTARWLLGTPAGQFVTVLSALFVVLMFISARSRH